MKQPKYNFNLEWNKNKNGSGLIFFNLSYGYKEFDTITQRYKYPPFRISTKYSIASEYWIGGPTFRANRTYTQKFGKDLNNTLQKIEDTSLHQLSLFRDENDRNPTPNELKHLVLVKLNRDEKINNDFKITDYIDKLITKRTKLPLNSKKYWSKSTADAYENLKNYIIKYEARKKISLTFSSITGEIFWDYFKTINDIKKEESGEYFVQNTISNQCSKLKSTLKCADEDVDYEIKIGFKYSLSEYYIGETKSSSETFLTDIQLKKIIKTDVSGLLKKFEHAKNYLILSSFTGLRIGDMVFLHEINPEKIRYKSKEYYCFYTKIRKSRENKTELAVVMPILKPVRELLKSNNMQFPKFPSQPKIRDYVKDFLEHLEFDSTLIKTYYYYLQKPEKEEFKQYELFTPHDCRSTFITNLKQLGLHNETIEPITHPKIKYSSILDTYDKSNLIDDAVKFINELNSKKSSIFKY